jgi:hypothetical protein
MQQAMLGSPISRTTEGELLTFNRASGVGKMKRFDRTDANQRRGDTVRIALILGSAIILLAIAQGCGERESPAGATLTAADSPQYIYSPQASSFFSLTAFRPKVDGSGQNDLVASFSWESRIGGYDLGMKAFQLDVAAKIHFFLDTEPPRWLNPHVSDFIEPQDMSPKTAKALGLVADAVRPLADDNGHSRPKFYLPGAGDHWRGPELDGRCSDLVRKFASGAIRGAPRIHEAQAVGARWGAARVKHDGWSISRAWRLLGPASARLARATRRKVETADAARAQDRIHEE